MKISDVDESCPAIRFRMNQLWKSFKPKISQHLNFQYGEEAETLENQISLNFPEPFGEEYVPELPFLIENVMRTLEALEEVTV